MANRHSLRDYSECANRGTDCYFDTENLREVRR